MAGESAVWLKILFDFFIYLTEQSVFFVIMLLLIHLFISLQYEVWIVWFETLKLKRERISCLKLVLNSALKCNLVIETSEFAIPRFDLLEYTSGIFRSSLSSSPIETAIIDSYRIFFTTAHSLLTSCYNKKPFRVDFSPQGHAL